MALFEKLWEILANVNIRLEDILKLSITETEAKKEDFPVQIFIYQPAHSSSPSTIKKALLASLMYPLELISPKSDSAFVQMYKNVPIQQIICAELDEPQAIDMLKFLAEEVCSQSLQNQSHSFYKILENYTNKVDEFFYATFYLPRWNAKESCFTSECQVFDFGLQPNKFLDRLCEIKEELSGKYSEIFESLRKNDKPK